MVVHPPFRWQRDYAREFVAGLARMEGETPIRFAVENMYPWRAGSREVKAYSPGWDVRDEDYPHTTLDLSHTAVSGTDARDMAHDLGDRLAHIHLADGSGFQFVESTRRSRRRANWQVGREAARQPRIRLHQGCSMVCRASGFDSPHVRRSQVGYLR